MVRRHFRDLPALGQSALPGNPRAAKPVRIVHGVPADVELRSPIHSERPLADSIADLQPDRYIEHVRRPELLSLAQTPAVRWRRNALFGIFSLGRLSRDVSVFATLRSADQRWISR